MCFFITIIYFLSKIESSALEFDDHAKSQTCVKIQEEMEMRMETDMKEGDRERQRKTMLYISAINPICSNKFLFISN